MSRIAARGGKLGLILGVALFGSSCKTMIEPWDKTNPDQTQRPQLPQAALCFCVTHLAAEPCSKQCQLVGLRPEPCASGGHIYPDCPHKVSAHAPGDPTEVGFDASGYLSDDQTPGPTLKLPMQENSEVYSFSFHAGIVGGVFGLRAEYWNPPPNHYFLTPTTIPPGDCQAEDRCANTMSLTVRYEDLQPLPEPTYTIGGDFNGPHPYVQCGKVSLCTSSESDQPHNIPGHYNVH